MAAEDTPLVLACSSHTSPFHVPQHPLAGGTGGNTGPVTWFLLAVLGKRYCSSCLTLYTTQVPACSPSYPSSWC